MENQEIKILQCILDELIKINNKLDSIRGSRGKTLDDICDSLNNVSKKIGMIDTNTRWLPFR